MNGWLLMGGWPGGGFYAGRAVHGCVGLRLVGGQEGRLDRLHTRGARERTHEPVVDTVFVVAVQAGQVAEPFTHAEIVHAYHTPGKENRNTCVKSSGNEFYKN